MASHASSRTLEASLRASQVHPFYVMEVMRATAEREKQGMKVLHMEVGQPATGAPAKALRAAHTCLDSGNTLGYTVANGLPELRERIARHYMQRCERLLD